MRKEEVEIFSDATNLAVMKHPGRHYPGSLVQGDTLYHLCSIMDDAIRALDSDDFEEARGCMNEVRNALWGRLAHYKEILGEHDIELPFSEIPPRR